MLNKEIEKDLVIIIVNYNNWKETENNVETLLNLKILANIVIVDNKSVNDSLYKLKEIFNKKRNVYVISSDKNGGYSYGNNFAIKYAMAKFNFKYICIMNPDVRLEDDILPRLCGILKKNEDIVGISSLMFVNNKFYSDYFSWKIPVGKEIYKSLFIANNIEDFKRVYDVYKDSLLKAEVLPGSFFVIKKDFFKKVNLFDENVFLYNEENILGKKIQELNKVCVIDTATHYLHLHFNRDRKETIERYKTEFSKILFENKVKYRSRKYYCQKYANGKYIFRLELVNILNVILLYIKKYLIKLHFIK